MKGFKIDCNEKPEKDGSFCGTVKYRNMQFHFTLHQQKEGNYRGRITVLDPATEKPTEFLKIQKYSADNKNRAIKQKSRELNCCVGCSRRDIENYLCDTVQSIYQSNERLFLRLRMEHADPDTITAGLACEVLGAEFVSKRYPNNTVETNIKKQNRLEDILADLSSHPMKYYSAHPGSAMTILKALSQKDLKMVSEFWDYVIAKEKLEMKNPVHVEESSKPSSRKRKAATEMKTLPKNTQAAFEKKLMDRHGGAECGAALVASGFSCKDACSKFWKDLKKIGLLNPDADETDFCVMKHLRPDLLIAVHDYSRPLIPVTAMVLQRRYQALLEDYSEEELDEMPIVSQRSNPCKAMDPSALQQEIKSLLIQAGIKEETLKLWKESRNDPISSRLLSNTYKANLVKRCLLNPQSGTYNFLLGRSFQDDTTSTNYVSYTCEAGQLRLYNILRRLRPKRKNEGDAMISNEEDQREITTIRPEVSDENAGVVIELLLQPGEEAVFSSRGGANLHAKAKILREDGLKPEGSEEATTT